MNLPAGAWQGALLAVIGGYLQRATQGEETNIIHVSTWIVLGAFIGMALAKFWSKRGH